MANIPTLVVSPSSASNAYTRANQLDSAGDGTDSGFGATLDRVINGAIASGHQADSETVRAIEGGGNLTQVVTAVAQAQLTLQTATVIRDRIVQAYQDIIKMQI